MGLMEEEHKWMKKLTKTPSIHPVGGKAHYIEGGLQASRRGSLARGLRQNPVRRLQKDKNVAEDCDFRKFPASHEFHQSHDECACVSSS
jgi:hypothetical protein